MASPTTISMAILKVNWDRLGHDYVESFVPFAVECAKENEAEVVSLPETQAAIRDRFGFSLPLNAVRVIIRRATKRGYFQRRNHVVYVVREKCLAVDLSGTRRAIEQTHNRVVSRLTKHARESHQTEWSESEAEEALSDFLMEDGLSVVFGAAALERRSEQATVSRYIVGSFVDLAVRTERGLLEDLTELAKGNLLANAMYLPDPRHVSRRFRDTAVYLDTSVVMFAAGLAGPDRQEPRLELLELLKRQGADLCCFRDTREEVEGILDACATRLRTGDLRTAYGPTIEYFLESGKTASDLELMAVQLPRKLRSLGIRVRDRPPYDERGYVIDERALEAHLDAKIGYANPRARVHDVTCLGAIAMLRKGKNTNLLEQCRAVFVTTNGTLARESRRFFREGPHADGIALAMTDYALGNVLWLKDPGVASDLPRKQLIASAYAAMQPSEVLWKAYLAEIAKLQEEGGISSEDYFLLRYSIGIKAMLMELTQGEQSEFTEGTPLEILQIAKQQQTEEFHRTIKGKEEEVAKVQSELQESEEKHWQTRMRAIDLGRKMGAAVRWTIFGLVVPPVIFTLGISWAAGSSMVNSPIESQLVDSVGVAVTGLIIWNLVQGKSVVALAEAIEGIVARAVTRGVFRWFGIADVDGV